VELSPQEGHNLVTAIAVMSLGAVMFALKPWQRPYGWGGYAFLAVIGAIVVGPILLRGFAKEFGF
jgi:hypothetical protein